MKDMEFFGRILQKDNVRINRIVWLIEIVGCRKRCGASLSLNKENDIRYMTTSEMKDY